MQLTIKLPDNLIVKDLLEKKNIPCLGKIKGLLFEIEFLYPLPQATGTVDGWTHEEIDERVPAGAGGEYTHYSFTQITLRSVGGDIYDVVDLSFFNFIRGWLPVLINGELCESQYKNTQEELDELDAMYPPVKSKKKRR